MEKKTVKEMLEILDEMGISREQYAEDESNPTEDEIDGAYEFFIIAPEQNGY